MQSLSIEKILKFSKKRVRNPIECMLYIIRTAVYEMVFVDKEELLDSDTGGIGVAVDTSGLSKRILKDGNDFLLESVTSFDKVLLQVMRHTQQYKNGGFKNYVPSSNFLDVMNQIDLDVPIKILDRNINAYFEIGGRVNDDDGIPALWVLVSTEERLGKRYLNITTYSTDNAPRHMMMRLEGDKISDMYNKLTDVRFVNGKAIEKENGVQYEKASFTRIVMNMVTYICGPNEDFVEQFNKFSTNNKTRQTEELNYTTKGYISLGQGIERLRVQTIGETTVRAFPRWQPCGVGREEIKLVFVREHTRTYKRMGEL